MQQAEYEKERRKSAEYNEELRVERELVQQAVQKALKEREKQIQEYQNKITQAKRDREEFI